MGTPRSRDSGSAVRRRNRQPGRQFVAVLLRPENGGMLPADQHVHTQWSLDAPSGSMREACVRAIELGLPAVTFTDHADLTTLVVSDDAAAFLQAVGGQVINGTFAPPPLEVAGYLDCVQQCQREFSGLRIRAGVELGDPHLHPQQAQALADSGFDLIVGSVHSLRRAAGFAEAADRYADVPDADVVREYLAEVTMMIENSAPFTVLAHINYAARYWPGRQGEYRSADFEEEYRTALRALARSGRALEINTSGWLPPDANLLTWWHAAGGTAVSFGSDAHDPVSIGREFASAAAMARSAGFGPDSNASDLWVRC
jgi:histidinol-phosphatase (PHP family)